MHIPVTCGLEMNRFLVNHKISARGRFRTQLLCVGALLALSLLMGCGRIDLTERGEWNQPMRIARTDTGLLFTEGRDSVLVYRDRVVRAGRPHARAHYIHPLFNLNGTTITEDFPDDHLHHHGVFWAWHQIHSNGRRVGDGWIQEDIVWTVEEMVTEPLAAAISDETRSSRPSKISTRVLWTSSGEEGQELDVVEEHSVIRVHPSFARGKTRVREIDFVITLRALAEDVRIGGSEDEKGYGGFSVRLRLPDDVAFTGQEGIVRPHETAVEAGPWVNITGNYDHPPDRVTLDVSPRKSGDELKGVVDNSPVSSDTRLGLVILQHPSNPGFPQPWILRSERSMQNVKWPGERPVRLSQSDPVILRYRLVVHDGTLNSEEVQDLYVRYAASSG